MASVSLQGVTKRFGAFTAVRAIGLESADAEFVAILGPSGCGKTTTMNMIAGIERPDEGAIRFDGQDVTGTPVKKRGIGFVFQNYAIFTHLTVRQNLAFGLEVRGVRGAVLDRRVTEMAEFMALTPRLDQLSAGLSVNEMQKLAIGRSAITEPRIFLLDEPLSNLDAAFRERMRADLRQLQRALRQTMIYVTHDQVEAMGLADRIAVMDQGVLQQFDTPARTYANPDSVFVARFIGAPGMNILPAEFAQHGECVVAHLGGHGGAAIELDARLARCAGEQNLRAVSLGFRPETLTIMDGPGPTAISAGVSIVETVGRRRIAHFNTGLLRFCGVFERGATLTLGETTHLQLDLSTCHFYDPGSGRRLTSDVGSDA